jgi:polyisoprenoid-binding protein YceI
MNAQLHKNISFYILSLNKVENMYEIKGFLILNGVKKEITSTVTIVQNRDTLKLDGTFSIKMSEFNIEPPTLLFLSVRDQVDITYNLNYKDN